MKHNFKRVFALFLAVVMCMTCTLPIFASNGEAGTCPEAGNEAAHNKNNCTAVVIDTVAPACETTGYTVYQCDVCKVYFMDDIVKAVDGCVWGEETIVPATCTTDGSKSKHCSTHNYTKVVTIPATGHNWSEWTPDGAICTEGGTTETRTCLNGCGATETQPATPGDHAWGAPVFNIVPTCTTEGQATYTCSACGATKTVLVKPMTEGTVHDWDMANAETVTDADCQTEGVIHVVCKTCGYEEDQKTGYADHDYSVSVPAKAATCTEEGYDAHMSCSVCGAHEPGFKTYDKLAHEFTVFVSRTEPKCGEDGKEVYKCANCDAENETILPRLGDHEFDVTPTDPTCTTYGHKYYFCVKCAYTKTDDIVEPYYHHLPTCEDHDACLIANNGVPCNMVDTGKGQAPNCTSTGTKIYACQACGAEKEVANATAPGVGQHNYEDKEIPATCISTGKKYKECSYCHDIIDEEELPIVPTAHDWVIEEVSTPATCTEPGRAITYCTLCSAKDPDTILPATGHNKYQDQDKKVLVDSYSYTAPTCVSKGYESYICNDCSELIINEPEIDPDAHNLVKNPSRTVTATCGVEGYEYWECSYCDYEEARKTADALVHNYVKDTVAALSCTNPVVDVTETCTNCGDVVVLETLTADLSLAQYHTNCNAQFDSHFRQGDCKKTGIDKYICGTTNLPFYVYFEEYGNGHPADDITSLDAKYSKYITIVDPYVAPTCVSKGQSIAWKCTCGATGGGIEIDYAAHDLKHVPAQAPNCLDYGWDEHYICQEGKCGDYFADAEGTELLANGFQDVYKEALGHDYLEVVTGVTCTTPGTIEDVCQRKGCNSVVQKAITPATGHNYEVTVVPVGCETVGYTHHICQNPACVPEGTSDYGIREYIDGYTRAIGHEWTETKDCINGDSWTCANDSKHDYVEEARGGHANVAGQPLTCKVDANVTDRVCAECGQEILPGTHSFVTSHVEPTCLKYGYTLKVCVVCQYYETVEDDIKTLGDHKPGNYVVTTPATCTTAGVETQYCTVCGEELATREIEALGHKYTVVVDEKAAEVLVPGYQILGCANGCGSTITNTIDALDGIKFSYSYDNAVKSGYNYVNTGKLAVTVEFETKNVTLNSILLALEFDADVLSFVEGTFTCDSAVFVDTKIGYDNTLGKVSISAKVNTENEENKEVTLADGKSGLAVLYFDINATAGYTLDAANNANLGLTVVKTGDQSSSVLDKDAKATIAVEYGTITAPSVTRLGDVNNDGAVTDADAVLVLEYLFGEGYSAQADMDQDGDIELDDYQLLRQFVVASITYEKLCAGEKA